MGGIIQSEGGKVTSVEGSQRLRANTQCREQAEGGQKE